MMRRKHWIIAAAILLCVLAGDVAYWRIAAERLRTGYQDWLAAPVADGWAVQSGPISIGGWPRTARVVAQNVTLRHAGLAVPGAIEVASAGVDLSVSLLNPASLRISLIGPTHVQVADSPDLIVTAGENTISVPLLSAANGPFVLRARDLRVEPSSGAWHTTTGLLNVSVSIADEAMMAARKRQGTTPGQQAASSSPPSQPDSTPADQTAAGQPKPPPSGPAVTFAASAEAIALPSVVKWPLGPNISSLTLDGTLNGPIPPAQDVTAWAEAWRDGGGSLAISHLTMGWGPLGLTSSATLALDEQLQPMGSGNGRVIGYAPTLDRLAAAGILTKSAATAAKAVLSLMAGAGDPDQPSTVDVPLTLQYRTLSMRQVPLVRLPELDWPAR